ncbi:MAG TPA: amino acid racemase [Jiangellaceae bacterium]|nr:amino acid racemase [Jiangellaceae bacterium]
MSKSVMPTTAGAVLGVLGGMGPAATADFLDKLAASTPAARDQEHIATLVYSDPTTPDRSDAMVAEGPDPLPALLHGIEFLSNAGVGAIAIPCNSAHFWYDQMQRATDVPILHIVDAVAEQVRARAGEVRRIGLMSTDGTARSGVYDRLADHGYELMDLTDLGADSPTTAGIRLVKSGDLDAARRTLTRAANELVDRGAQGIVYGCTDISAVLGPAPSGIDVPVWDSATALAAASVDYIRSERHAGGTATRKVTHGAL